MAANVFTHGKLVYVQVGGQFFAALGISHNEKLSDLTDITFTRSGGATARNSLPGYAYTTGTVSFVWDAGNIPLSGRHQRKAGNAGQFCVHLRWNQLIHGAGLVRQLRYSDRWPDVWAGQGKLRFRVRRDLHGRLMDFPSTMGAPRICYAGERFFMIRPLSLEGHAILLQWLDDVLPGREERKLPPSPNTPEALAALDSPTGKALMIWLALRGHGISENEAAAISDSLTELERYIFVRALYTRRRTFLVKQPKTEADEDRDISETWCAKDMAELTRAIGLSKR